MARSFIKHKVFGTVYAVEISEDGAVLAAKEMTEATACRHKLDAYMLTLDLAPEINQNLRDYSQTELPCSDATHLLSDIGEAEKACAEAQSNYDQLHAKSKAAKETLESREHALRKLVREATSQARPLPLFDQPQV